MKIRRRSGLSLMLVAALAVTAPLSGCVGGADGDEPSSQSQTENGNSGDQSSTDGAPEDTDSGSDSDTDKLPKWVTENFPIHPDSRISTVSDTGSPNHESRIIGAMVTGVDGQSVVDWYAEQYDKDGWSIGSTQNDGARFNAEHEDGYMAVVGVSTMSSGSVVTITAHQPV